MATLTPTLTITSTDASADETLSLSVTDSLTIGPPSIGMSKIAIANASEPQASLFLLDLKINMFTLNTLVTHQTVQQQQPMRYVSNLVVTPIYLD